MNTDNLIVISMLICCLTFCGEPDLHDAILSHIEAEQPQKEALDKIAELHIEHFLTVKDLESVYACVDQKIKNRNSVIKFPCLAVRGDSF